MYHKHLDVFIAVAEAGSFSAAAERLYVSRAALIQQINLLEDQVGVPLFVRHHKGVTQTEAGAYLLGEAKKIVNISQRALQRCRDMQREHTVRIGMLPNFSPSLLPDICRRFSAQYPDITLSFVEYPLEEYFRRFTEGCFDITTEYLSGYIYDHPEYRILKLAEDRHCCGVPRNHPLAEKPFITLEDLTGQSVLMYSSGITKADDKLREYLLCHGSDIDIIDTRTYQRTLPLDCELHQWILIYYSMYHENFVPLVPVPLQLRENFPIDIGLGYKASASDAVKKFLSVAYETFAADKAGVKR